MGRAAESFDRRFSLCCGREGCRRRATPPSVRFLGRRVYVGAVVIVASVLIAPNAVVRGMFTAVRWLVRRSRPARRGKAVGTSERAFT
jgi:hypothetical protein